VARLRGAVHPATLAVRDFMRARLETWLAEVGVRDLVDLYGRLHGTANVHVADASLLPTNGGVNPCLTTMANAWRVADAIAAQSPR